jgi:hypothetical protein
MDGGTATANGAVITILGRALDVTSTDSTVTRTRKPPAPITNPTPQVSHQLQLLRQPQPSQSASAP